MPRDRVKLIQVPRLRVLTANVGGSRCPRCGRVIAKGERTIQHSTDGEIHYACLRTGQRKQFVGAA